MRIAEARNGGDAIKLIVSAARGQAGRCAWRGLCLNFRRFPPRRA
jgi:hypothetical protein